MHSTASSGVVLRVEMPSDRARIQNRSPIPMMLWPASMLLSKLLLSVPDLIHGKRALELGAGFHAVVALTCARGGVHSIVTTDRDGAALERMRDNIALNAETVQAHMVTVERLDWEHAENNDHLRSEHFDVILGSDIIHEVAMAALVKDMLLRFLKPGGICIMVNAQKMHRFGVEEFHQLMEKSAEFEFRMEPVDFIADCDDDWCYDCYSIRRVVPIQC